MDIKKMLELLKVMNSMHDDIEKVLEGVEAAKRIIKQLDELNISF